MVQHKQARNALELVKDDLSLILSYRIPHFTHSVYWENFVHEYPHLLHKCITTLDLEKWSKVTYKKKDFMTDCFTTKEDLLCDLMKEDQSVFRLQKTVLDGALSVYLWDGKDLLNEKDIGLGKFQGFKVAGTLAYPPWLVMMAASSAKFHSKVWKGYKFDREYDFNYIKGQRALSGEVINYDSHISKIVLDYGSMLNYRSCYVIFNNLYRGNRTYLFTKSIAPHDGKYQPNIIKEDLHNDIFESEEVRYPFRTNNPVIDKHGRKKCIYLPNLSLFTVLPEGNGQSLFSFISLLNPGGLLLSKIGTPEKRMLSIAENYRSHMIHEIEHLLQDDHRLLRSMSSVYDTVKDKLDLYKHMSGSVESHIFEGITFEERLLTL